MDERAGFAVTDIHSHVLPALDDGARTWESALAMCRLYVEQRVTTVVATPHMCDPRYPVTVEAVRRGVVELTQRCQSEDIPLTILPGGDVRLMPELLEWVDQDEVLTLGDAGRYLLLELPAQTVPPIGGLLEELGRRGIRVVVSHPERNMELWWRPTRLAELVEFGCLVQLTGDSLLGRFGRRARRCSEQFLAAGLVDVVASDAHSHVGRAPAFGEIRQRLAELVGEDAGRRLLSDNPQCLAHGQPLRRVSSAKANEEEGAGRAGLVRGVSQQGQT
jgi:protein-tyrosine phosphatase